MPHQKLIINQKNVYITLRYAYYVDPFDFSDHCHLAWLIRDNWHLLQAVAEGAQCSNETYFSTLNGFDNCPVIIQ